MLWNNQEEILSFLLVVLIVQNLRGVQCKVLPFTLILCSIKNVTWQFLFYCIVPRWNQYIFYNEENKSENKKGQKNEEDTALLNNDKYDCRIYETRSSEDEFYWLSENNDKRELNLK